MLSQQTPEQRILPDESLKKNVGLACRRSHSSVCFSGPVAARMCGAWMFHASPEITSASPVVGPGISAMSGRFKSHTNISDSADPVASSGFPALVPTATSSAVIPDLCCSWETAVCHAAARSAQNEITVPCEPNSAEVLRLSRIWWSIGGRQVSHSLLVST